MSDRFRTFEEFWPFYVREHSKQWTRRLHFVGTTLTNLCVAKFFASGKARWLAYAAIGGYGPAWISHFFIEGNRPATFRYPLWSLMADYKMYFLTLTGEMDAEVERVMREATAQAAPVEPTQSNEVPVNTRVTFEA